MESLGQIGGPREAATAPLVVALSDDDADYRAAAARTLAAMGPDAADAADALVQMFRSDPERNNRVEAARALGQLGEEAVVPVLAEATDALVEMLNDEEGPVRVAAALALWRIDHENALSLPTLIAALTDSHQETREFAARALGTLEPAASPALSAFIAALGDESWIVRSEAAQTLGAIGPAAAEATPALIELLLDEEEYFGDGVRRSAAGALGKLGAGAVPHLIAAFGHPRLAVRVAATEALGEIGAAARPALSRLQTLREDDYVTLRNAAAKALQSIRQTSPERF
ncbi:HEAT repeat domain-containing protein [Candidatus Laterigemmans baculatus]|uniref:HEAT repeat domain-containing protein n=1 Tax=Candidatus Laterigemmans baculatus TaxID=2770505 RepID=UPI0013DB9428